MGTDRETIQAKWDDASGRMQSLMDRLPEMQDKIKKLLLSKQAQTILLNYYRYQSCKVEEDLLCKCADELTAKGTDPARAQYLKQLYRTYIRRTEAEYERFYEVLIDSPFTSIEQAKEAQLQQAMADVLEDEIECYQNAYKKTLERCKKLDAMMPDSAEE